MKSTIVAASEILVEVSTASEDVVSKATVGQQLLQYALQVIISEEHWVEVTREHQRTIDRNASYLTSDNNSNGELRRLTIVLSSSLKQKNVVKILTIM